MSAPSPIAGELELERVTDLGDIPPGDWDRLAEAAGHPFATREWVSAWWRWFGAGRPLHTFLCRDDAGAIVAILPLYIALTRPIRVARFLGYGDLHAPICAPADRPRAAAALLRTLGRGSNRSAMIMAERLPGDEGWGELLGGALTVTDSDPALNLNGMTWEELLASKSRNMRSSVRRQERRLEADYELKYRMVSTRDEVDAGMSELFRLHDARFGEESVGVFAGERGRMHRELAAEAFDRGWVRLWFLELDGRAVATYYGWRFAGSEWFLQSGRDPEFEEQNVGRTMISHVIRDACGDGVSTFRFLMGDEPYKLRWADQVNEPETRLLAAGAVGRLGTAAMKRVGSLPDGLRARVMGMVR